MWNKYTVTPLSLIETILVLPQEIPLLYEHLQRIKESVQQLGWPEMLTFYTDVEQDLLDIAKDTTQPTVYKLEWTFSGYQYAYHFTNRTIPNPKELKSWTLEPHQMFYNVHAPTRNLKLAYRDPYNIAKEQHPQAKDLLIINQYGHLTESSIANLFFKIEHQWFTPCLSTGAVNGVFRRYFIKQERVQPLILSIDQIHKIDEMYLGNAIRGLWKVQLG